MSRNTFGNQEASESKSLGSVNDGASQSASREAMSLMRQQGSKPGYASSGNEPNELVMTDPYHQQNNTNFAPPAESRAPQSAGGGGGGGGGDFGGGGGSMNAMSELASLLNNPMLPANQINPQ